jgi:hypothetical protein
LLSEVLKEVNNSIGDVMIIANEIGGEKAIIIKNTAMTAFQETHNTVLILAGFVLATLTLILVFVLPKEKKIK